MQKRKLNERTFVDELLENQDVVMDIINHEEVREEVPSGSSKKQKANKRSVKKSSEKDRPARETEKERLKQLSYAREDNLKAYVNNFSNRATNALVVKFHKVLIFSRNALIYLFFMKLTIIIFLLFVGFKRFIGLFRTLCFFQAKIFSQLLFLRLSFYIVNDLPLVIFLMMHMHIQNT